jgi:hypothetical protein
MKQCPCCGTLAMPGTPAAKTLKEKYAKPKGAMRAWRWGMVKTWVGGVKK